MSVFKVQEEVFMIRRDLAKANYVCLKNGMHFLQAVGTINEESLEEVDRWLQQREK
jgi:hypothetical protein